MAKCGITNIGGGGGIGSDELTSTLSDVLKGCTAVTSDSDDEIGAGTLELTGTATIGDVLKDSSFYNTNAKSKLTGTLELTGTATPNQVIEGYTFYNTNAKSKLDGAVVNRGAVTSSLNAGGSYMVPAGYHNGSGKVTANSLASQTVGTATAPRILSGYTAWVNGIKLTGSAVDYSYLATGQTSF